MPRKSKAGVKSKRGKGVLKAGAGQGGAGFLDILKKAASVAQTLSAATGIKPSSLLAASGHPLAGLASSALASQGLGRRGKGRRGGCKSGNGQTGGDFLSSLSHGFSPFAKDNRITTYQAGYGQNGGNFWDDFSRGFAMPFKAVGDLASGAVGGLLGNGRRGRGRRMAGGECATGYPGVGGNASVVKF